MATIREKLEPMHGPQHEFKPWDIPNIVGCRRCKEYPELKYDNWPRPVLFYYLKCRCKIRSVVGMNRRDAIKKWNERQGRPYRIGGMDGKYK